MRSRADNGNGETCKTVNGKIVMVAPGDFAAVALIPPRNTLNRYSRRGKEDYSFRSIFLLDVYATVSCAVKEKSSSR